MRKTSLLLLLLTTGLSATQTPSQPDWPAVDEETLRHFQAVVRMDTTDPPGTPPGGERPVAEYVKQVLDKEGIPAQLYALEPNRPNVVARLKGNGKKRPLLILGHTDTVNVDAKKWTYPPFSAERRDGYVYGRGTVDDKDNLTAMLMTMLLLKRNNVPLDRDVIFLSEGGEEGATRIGIQYMVNQHWDAIDAEFCYAEGGNVTRVGGKVKYASVQTVEKIPRAIKLTSKGTAGHGSVPLEDNAVAHLGEAVGAIAAWTPPTRLNETTTFTFRAAPGGVRMIDRVTTLAAAQGTGTVKLTDNKEGMLGLRVIRALEDPLAQHRIPFGAAVNIAIAIERHGLLDAKHCLCGMATQSLSPFERRREGLSRGNQHMEQPELVRTICTDRLPGQQDGTRRRLADQPR